MSLLTFPNPNRNRPVARPDLTVITVSDLKLSSDGKVARYTLPNGRTYDVIISVYFSSVPALVASVKDAKIDDDMNPWVEEAAFEAGIRVEF